MRQAKVRQEDIARAAGVAIFTLSRVLSGAPGIRPATTKKLLRAAAEQGMPLTLPAQGDVPAADQRMQRALLFLKQVELNSGSGSIYRLVMTGIQKAALHAGL